MATRVFKFTDLGVDYTESFIRFIDEESIGKQYNVYQYYRKVKNFEEILETYQESWEEAKELGEYETEEEFAEDYEWDYEYVSYYGKPTEFVNPNEEDWASDLEGWYNEDGTPVDDEDLPMMCEYIEEWDGTNMTQTVLTSEYTHVNVEELTDKYKNVNEEWEHIAGYRKNNETNWDEYYYHEKTKTFWKGSHSLWQGSFSEYTLLEDTADIEYAIAEAIYNEYNDNVKDHWIEFLNDDLGLKEDESFVVKDHAIWFKKSDKEVRLTWDEIYCDNFSNLLPYQEVLSPAKWIDIDLSDCRDKI